MGITGPLVHDVLAVLANVLHTGSVFDWLVCVQSALHSRRAVSKPGLQSAESILGNSSCLRQMVVVELHVVIEACPMVEGFN